MGGGVAWETTTQESDLKALSLGGFLIKKVLGLEVWLKRQGACIASTKP